MTGGSATENARWQQRVARHAASAIVLSQLTDDDLAAVVTAAPELGSGIGGARSVVEIDGSTLFVKRVPLTDLERLPQHARSTANLFGLPVGCQYGVGSPSFGVWREVAANEMATGWVVSGRSPNFPLLHHWRVLDGPASAEPLSDELADPGRAAAYWDGSMEVGERVTAINASTATVTMFFEHAPTTLTDWLTNEIACGGQRADAAITSAIVQLRAAVTFMNSNDIFHFDAHLDNMLVVDGVLLIADFGLATSPHFDLSPIEAAFLADNRSHDIAHTTTRLLDWFVMHLTDVVDWQARDELIVAIAAGRARPFAVSNPAAARFVQRCAPVAVVINAFYRQLHLDDRAAPYPRAAVLAACRACGVDVP